MIDRDTIVSALQAAFEPLPAARAAWQGGAAATGRLDQWSDVDLHVLMEDGAAEESFQIAHDALATISPVEIAYRIPEPTWHGHHQTFYRLRDAGPFLLVDLVLMNLSNPLRYLEPERHGDPVILFDKDNLVVPDPLDRASHDRNIQARLEHHRARFEIFRSMPLKSAKRGHAVEAMAFYQGMILRPLVDLLRIRHCPDRFDFGLRYLDRDLPPELYATVTRLAYPTDANAIPALAEEATTLFNIVLAEIDAG